MFFHSSPISLDRSGRERSKTRSLGLDCLTWVLLLKNWPSEVVVQHVGGKWPLDCFSVDSLDLLLLLWFFSLLIAFCSGFLALSILDLVAGQTRLTETVWAAFSLVVLFLLMPGPLDHHFLAVAVGILLMGIGKEFTKLLECALQDLAGLWVYS